MQKLLQPNQVKPIFKDKQQLLKRYILKEANGLTEIANANVIRVPKVIFAADDYLILENIVPKTKNKMFWENFGRDFGSFTSLQVRVLVFMRTIISAQLNN